VVGGAGEHHYVFDAVARARTGGDPVDRLDALRGHRDELVRRLRGLEAQSAELAEVFGGDVSAARHGGATDALRAA
jgi:hypothetical protein